MPLCQEMAAFPIKEISHDVNLSIELSHNKILYKIIFWLANPEISDELNQKTNT